jgi:hypothetical protein
MADAWGGSWGSAWGVSWGQDVTPIEIVSKGGIRKKLLERDEREDPRDDIERVWKRLTEATEDAQEIVVAHGTDLPAFEPAENRLTDALAVAGQLLESIRRFEEGERERIRQAMERARVAQAELAQRLRIEREEREAAEREAKHQAKLRRFRMTAMLLFNYLDD